MPGLSNTRVIHPAFQAHHRPVTDGAMSATCVITRPASSGTPAFSEAAATSQHPAPATVYDGKCRITVRSVAPTGEVVADRTVYPAEYIVSIPADAPAAQVNDLVRITACAGDPALVGLRLTVGQVRHGSIAWQRDLICDLSQPTTR